MHKTFFDGTEYGLSIPAVVTTGIGSNFFKGNSALISSSKTEGRFIFMKAAFITLGCKVNQYETEIIQRQFEEAGFTVVPPAERADVYIINSCTVTAMGDRKSRQLLRQARRRNPAAVIAVTGCFPQAFPEEAAAIAEADIVTGATNRAALLSLVKQALEGKREKLVEILPHHKGEPFEPMQAKKFSEHTRAFVKIEDGCDRWCSYCIIPKARGPVRSKPLSRIAEELAGLAENGYREVVLVGINLSSYGKEDGALKLAEAVETACSVPGIERVRLGSLEPELLTDSDLARMAAQDKFCPQFHLSLQSGCDATLKRMNRHYTAAEYRGLVEKIRKNFDRPAITTDMMVGFPGETEEEFSCSCAFADEIGFAKVHVFAYSVRPGTRAASLPEQVDGHRKEERSRRLIALTDHSRTRFFESQLPSVQQVLFETRRPDGRYSGYTKNYTPVFVQSTADLCGKILPVRLETAEPEGCCGCLTE